MVDTHSTGAQVGKLAADDSVVMTSVAHFDTVLSGMCDRTSVQHALLGLSQQHGAGHIESGLYRAVPLAGRMPVGVSEGDILELNVVYAFGSLARNHQHVFEAGGDCFGSVHILFGERDIVEFPFGAVQVPLAGFGEHFEYILHVVAGALIFLIDKAPDTRRAEMHRVDLGLDPGDMVMHLEPELEGHDCDIGEILPRWVDIAVVVLGPRGTASEIVAFGGMAERALEAVVAVPGKACAGASSAVDKQLSEIEAVFAHFGKVGYPALHAVDLCRVPRVDTDTGAEPRLLPGVCGVYDRPVIRAGILRLQAEGFLEEVCSIAEPYDNRSGTCVGFLLAHRIACPRHCGKGAFGGARCLGSASVPPVVALGRYKEL